MTYSLPFYGRFYDPFILDLVQSAWFVENVTVFACFSLLNSLMGVVLRFWIETRKITQGILHAISSKVLSLSHIPCINPHPIFLLVSQLCIQQRVLTFVFVFVNLCIPPYLTDVLPR